MGTAIAEPRHSAAPKIEMPDEEVYDISSLGGGIVLKHRETIELKVEKAADFLNHSEF